MRRALIVAAVLTVLPLAASARTDRRIPPAAVADGAPVDCVPLRSISSTRVHGDKVIDFHMLGRKVYRNTLPQSCPSLGFEERFTYTTSLSQLCSVDTITVLYTSDLQRGATCGLGKFEPVKLAKR